MEIHANYITNNMHTRQKLELDTYSEMAHLYTNPFMELLPLGSVVIIPIVQSWDFLSLFTIYLVLPYEYHY